MTAGIRTTNLVRDDGAQAVEVLVHADEGGQLKLRRQSLDIFISRILAQAGGSTPGATEVLAVLTARGFVIGSDGKLHLTQAEADLAAEIIRAQAAEIYGVRADEVRAQHRYIPRFVTGTPRRVLVGDIYGPGNFVRWEVGDRPGRLVGSPLGVVFWIGGLSNIFSFSLLVYRRPASVGNGGPGGAYVSPGEHAQNVLISGSDTQVRDLVSTPLTDAPTPVMMPFDQTNPFVMTADNIYFYVLGARDYSGQPAPIGVQRGRSIVNSTVDPVWRQGAFRGPTGGSVAPSDGGMVAHALMEARYVEGYATGADARGLVSSGPRMVPLRQFTPVSDTVYSVELPGMSLANQPTPIRVTEPGSIVAVDRPSYELFDVNLTLTQNVTVDLGIQWIDGVVVTSGGSTWTLGTDYRLNKINGRITSLRAGSATVRVTGNYCFHRYDLIVASPQDGSPLVVKGGARGLDPNGYGATAPGFYPLYRAYVCRDYVELVPVHEWSGFTRRGREAEYQAHLARNCRCLQRTLALLSSGQPIRIGGYGDSITAVGGGSDYYTPDGPTRDRLDFLPFYLRSQAQAYDGPAGAGQHVRISYGWVFKTALERRYGSIVEYRNWGVAGSDTANGLVGGQIPGGLYPQRLSAYLADQCHLTLLAFGMNQFAAGNTYSDTVSIIQQIQAQGGEVIVITPPRANSAEGWVIDDWQMITHRDLVRAALATGSAYVDFSAISGPGNEAAMGLVSRTMCEQKHSNHLGPYEYSKYGAYVAETFSSF